VGGTLGSKPDRSRRMGFTSTGLQVRWGGGGSDIREQQKQHLEWMPNVGEEKNENTN